MTVHSSCRFGHPDLRGPLQNCDNVKKSLWGGHSTLHDGDGGGECEALILVADKKLTQSVSFEMRSLNDESRLKFKSDYSADSYFGFPKSLFINSTQRTSFLNSY